MLHWISKNTFPLYLAPMARFTDIAFRQMCKNQGADVMVTEFVQADAIIRGDDRLWETFDFSESQRPMGVQIFGSNPLTMAEAAKRIHQRIAPDFIDINYGCPADRVICMDAGSSLLRNPNKLGVITKHVVTAVPEIPVTVKIRIGWDELSINALEIGKIVEDVGAKALTIHGRTKVQGYRGDANWDIIAKVAESIQIPVIGNGSIQSAQDVIRVKNETQCTGVMIGRAALGYPWIFRDIKHYLTQGTLPSPPSVEERWKTIIEYTETVMARAYHLERRSDIKWMRPKIIALTKEMKGSKKIRTALGTVSQIKDLKALAAEHSAFYKLN